MKIILKDNHIIYCYIYNIIVGENNEDIFKYYISNNKLYNIYTNGNVNKRREGEGEGDYINSFEDINITFYIIIMNENNVLSKMALNLNQYYGKMIFTEFQKKITIYNKCLFLTTETTLKYIDYENNKIFSNVHCKDNKPKNVLFGNIPLDIDIFNIIYVNEENEENNIWVYPHKLLIDRHSSYKNTLSPSTTNNNISNNDLIKFKYKNKFFIGKVNNYIIKDDVIEFMIYDENKIIIHDKYGPLVYTHDLNKNIKHGIIIDITEFGYKIMINNSTQELNKNEIIEAYNNKSTDIFIKTKSRLNFFT